MPALDDSSSGPLRRLIARLRDWVLGQAAWRRRARERRANLAAVRWRAPLEAWTRWLDDARLWEAVDPFPLEVRGTLRGFPTRVTCEPGADGLCWLRLELTPEPPARLPESLPAEARGVGDLGREGYHLVLSQGRVVAAGRRRLDHVDPRHLRDTFERMIELLSEIQGEPLARVTARSEAERCPYCHDELDAELELVECAACGTVHHAACARELPACTVLGCSGERWRPRRSQSRSG